jgi:hypothetical protein
VSNISLQCINIIFHLYFFLFSSRLKRPRWWPSILHPSLFSSPKKSFHLPIYAEAMAHAFITDLATPKASPQFVGDLRILEYLIVLIQHQVVHLGLIHTGIAVRVVLLTLQTSGHVIWAHAL